MEAVPGLGRDITYSRPTWPSLRGTACTALYITTVYAHSEVQGHSKLANRAAADDSAPIAGHVMGSEGPCAGRQAAAVYAAVYATPYLLRALGAVPVAGSARRIDGGATFYGSSGGDAAQPY